MLEVGLSVVIRDWLQMRIDNFMVWRLHIMSTSWLFTHAWVELCLLSHVLNEHFPLQLILSSCPEDDTKGSDSVMHASYILPSFIPGCTVLAVTLQMFLFGSCITTIHPMVMVSSSNSCGLPNLICWILTPLLVTM